MIALLTTVAHAACLKTASIAEIEVRLQQAETAWAALDGDAFTTALDDAALLLPCLTEVAPPAFAARYHRMIALRTWGTGDVERASWSMQAARTLDPAYAFPDELLAPNHDLRLAYATLPVGTGPTHHPARPRGGRLWFDGLGPDGPTDRATLVQVQARDGSLQTRLLRPGDALPPYDAVPRSRNALLAVSGALLAGAAGFYGAAWATHGAFYAPDARHDVADLERIAARSQVYTGLAVGAAAIGLGAGGSALIWVDR